LPRFFQLIGDIYSGLYGSFQCIIVAFYRFTHNIQVLNGIIQENSVRGDIPGHWTDTGV